MVDDYVAGVKENDVDIDVKDVRIVGSNCSYNYTAKSDLDVHIIADLSGKSCPDDLYPALYNAWCSS